jgi:uncharacterized protein with von Willebrand factor type A (vWA) domain
MPDARSLTRLFDELLWTLRRGGFRIPTSEAIEALRAVQAVGLKDRWALAESLASIVVDRADARPRFDRIFSAFFARASPHASLFDRLLASGFTPDEIGEFRDILERLAATSPGDGEHLAALLERGAPLDRLLGLAGISRTAASIQSSLQLGFATYRVLGELGVGRARDTLAALRARLREALGDARGDALADALRAELERAEGDVRAHLTDLLASRKEDARAEPRQGRLDTTAFTSLGDAEMEEVKRAVRQFAERLRGADRVRRKRAKRGRLNLAKTMRRAMRTGGVPFVLLRARRRRDKPRLVLLCDVSDSVRAAARFMLELVYAAQELFDGTRSFVFVSEIGETTKLFATEPVAVALGHAYGGGVVSVAANSNYGRALRSFEKQHLGQIDRRTTVVILGDGRTNYQDDASDVLDRIRERARALVWLCPEDRSGWLLGDSAMARYAPKCTAVFETTNARELEVAARRIVALR